MIAARWLTVANGLSLIRLVATVPTVWAVASGRPGIAAALFGVAVATDLADGAVARRRNEASALGGVIDHTVDATYVTVLTGALAANGVLPIVLPALIAAAFVQYLLDSKALAGHALKTSRLGRWNGIAYFALAGTPIIRDALGLAFPGDALVMAAGWVIAATTVASMADRLVALLRRRHSATDTDSAD